MALRLIDKIRVEVRAGRGGDGIVAYTAHKLKRLLGPGTPCGGNGGRGGDVSIVAKASVRSLGSIVPVICAGHGHNGKRERINGSAGEDIVIKVPVGVTVFEEDGKTVLSDLDKDNESVVVAVGGAGGKGNNRARPHESTNGEPGTSRKLVLELKTIADIGLVGFPNAGKSSLLGFISRASPQVAPYPFTTLSPFVGTVGYGDDKRITVADIPGLVEEAHLNRGMGHEFLRHVERTKALLFVLDSTNQHWNPREPATKSVSMDESLRVLRKEVELYDEQLARKPWGVVVNKIDPEAGDLTTIPKRLEEADRLDKQLRISDSAFRGLVAISAKHGIGKKSLLDLLDILVHRPV
jgi:GTP-binding protein